MALTSPYLARRVRLELTPLMDVMFLVLVFFVYSLFAMAVHRGVKVELPAAAGVHEKGERAVVTLDAAHTLQLNGRPCTRETLVRELGRLVAARADLPVIISGDRRAALGEGLELLAALKKAGVKHISFQVAGPAVAPATP